MLQRSAATSWRRYVFAFVSLLVLGMLSPAGAGALSLEQVGNFASPTYVTSDPGDPDRLFVVERSGRIKLVENGEAGVFLDIEPIVLSPPDDRALGDHGLFSMAFSPAYATDHLFYVAYSRADDPDTVEEDESGEWHIAEFTANGDSADPASRREVLTIEYPQAQLHYAGQLHFGPDGYLFASTGDGGPQGDPDGNAQSLDSLYGKILRIDPHSTLGSAYTVPADNPFAGAIPGKDEIWSYGLRNPWRFSFDRLTGDLVIGDVGYSTWEEVDFATGPDPGKGDNFGWNCWEGMNQFSTAPPCDAAQAFTEPVFEYEHLDGNCSITGGYVVRDPALGDLYGRYLYSDWCRGELHSLALVPPVLDRSEGLCVQRPTSFGEDSSGRIYVTTFDGPVYRLAAGGSSGACPPDTAIDTGPTGTITTDQATFTFSGSPAGDTAKIQCKLDAGAFADCTSPKTFTGLTDGPHTATFRAEDTVGNQDQSPATRTFTVDTSASEPPGPTPDPPDVIRNSGNNFDKPTYYSDQGDLVQYEHTGGSPHNVFSTQFSGGERLFESATISSGTTPVNGTQLLAPGTYPFVCTIHNGMDAELVVRYTDPPPPGTDPPPPGTDPPPPGTDPPPPGTDPPPPGTDPSDTTVYKAKIKKVKVGGPGKVKKGKKATYKVKITNSGNVKATGVKLKVGGRGANSKKSVGKIAAKRTRTVKVKLKPKRIGKVKLTFKVTSSDAGGKIVKKKITVKK